MEGQEQGAGGQPGDYRYVNLQEPELYDLETDSSETKNVAALHPDIVDKITKLADAKRQELGDNLLDIKGKENREPGRSK